MRTFGLIALASLALLALTMGLLMVLNGEGERGAGVVISAAGPLYLITRLRRGLSVLH